MQFNEFLKSELLVSQNFQQAILPVGDNFRHLAKFSYFSPTKLSPVRYEISVLFIRIGLEGIKEAKRLVVIESFGIDKTPLFILLRYQLIT